MTNENNTQGGTSRKQVNKDGNAAKGGAAALVIGTIATVATLIAKNSGKTIVKLGNIELRKKK